MRIAVRQLLAASVLLAGLTAAGAQGLVGQEKQILPMTKANWIAFRDYDGKQWIYFTHLLAYRCGLAEIRYSADSDALDRTFPLPACDPQRPNAIDPIADPPYLTLAPGSVAEILVRVVYADGEESEAVRFAPCVNAGDSACAVLVE
jgi:hypothetical protein